MDETDNRILLPPDGLAGLNYANLTRYQPELYLGDTANPQMYSYGDGTAQGEPQDSMMMEQAYPPNEYPQYEFDPNSVWADYSNYSNFQPAERGGQVGQIDPCTVVLVVEGTTCTTEMTLYGMQYVFLINNNLYSKILRQIGIGEQYLGRQWNQIRFNKAANNPDGGAPVGPGIIRLDSKFRTAVDLLNAVSAYGWAVSAASSDGGIRQWTLVNKVPFTNK